MLDLSAGHACGTITHLAPPEHTRFARRRLGAEALVASWLGVAVDDDPERAALRAHEFAANRLDRSNYRNHLLRLGFTEDDVTGSGSARLIERLVPQGDPASVAAGVRDHLEAGADHVCLQPAGVTGIPRDEWTALAEELLTMRRVTPNRW
jgi:probable F420-dependent oxidoreductase